VGGGQTQLKYLVFDALDALDALDVFDTLYAFELCFAGIASLQYLMKMSVCWSFHRSVFFCATNFNKS
jgi:hypothetical protein